MSIIRTGTVGTIKSKDMTIGVELEMVLFDLPRSVKIVPYGDLEFIANALKELANKMGVLRLIFGTIPEELEFLPSQDTSSKGLEQRQHMELHFQIKDDISVRPRHHTSPNIRGRGVEVCTPILTHKNWKQTVRSMCASILTACEKSGATVDFNDTCGLHVHIGIGRDYTVRELKQISKAVALFEEEMDRHHPEHRSHPPPTSARPSMIAPNRSSHGLRGLTPAQMIWRIDEQITVEEVLRVINGSNDATDAESSRFYKYNLTCALTYKTVEFRQAAGTIDMEWIVEWVENCCNFISAAVATNDDTWYDWAEDLSEIVKDSNIRSRFGLPEALETETAGSVVDEEDGSLISRLQEVTLEDDGELEYDSEGEFDAESEYNQDATSVNEDDSDYEE